MPNSRLVVGAIAADRFGYYQTHPLVAQCGIALPLQGDGCVLEPLQDNLMAWDRAVQVNLFQRFQQLGG